MSRGRRQDEASDLKKEVDSLRRQVSRLRKENERLQADGEESPAPEETGAAKCPKCGSEHLAQVKTPSGKKITSCRTCKGWRSRAT